MTAADPAPSPCQSICRLDCASRICLGCGRTVEEIAAWTRLDETQKANVLRLLPSRLEKLAAQRKACGLGGEPG